MCIYFTKLISWELTSWEVDLVGVDLVGVDLVGVDLVGVDLMGVDLVGGHCLIGLLSTMRPHFEPLHCRTMLGNVTVAR